MRYFFLLVTHCFALGLDLKGVNNLDDWTLLQDGPIIVGWQEFQGYPISKAEMTMEYDMLSIAELIKNIGNYPNIFKRVTDAKQLEPDIVQIILDMPFPFAGRDYVVKYSIEQKDDRWVFSFYSVDHPRGYSNDKYVRLPNAPGVWILDRTSSEKTMVTYAWNGELLGNFPDFGLKKAWITQGTEVLTWLNEALSKKIKS